MASFYSSRFHTISRVLAQFCFPHFGIDHSVIIEAMLNNVNFRWSHTHSHMCAYSHMKCVLNMHSCRCYARLTRVYATIFAYFLNTSNCICPILFNINILGMKLPNPNLLFRCFIFAFYIIIDQLCARE